ncbi:hypothetical protein GCM10027062_12870 [Nocardioides hungaricus]
MPAPTFLCIGAQKCGTTWLASAVAQHPEVGTGRRKELHFFDQRDAYARGLGWYESQFRTTPATRAVGEFTPNYWRTVGTPADSVFLGSADRVADAYPDLRLIVCLRDPVDRAVSAYFHNIKAGRLSPEIPLLDAVRERPGLRDFGNYGSQLDAWLTRFPIDRYLFLLYEEDIRPDTAKPAALRRTFEHVGVDPSFEPVDISERRNVRLSDFEMRRRHASPMGRWLMSRLPERMRASPRWEITVPDADRAALAADFAPEVARLEEILGRPMPWAQHT